MTTNPDKVLKIPPKEKPIPAITKYSNTRWNSKYFSKKKNKSKVSIKGIMRIPLFYTFLNK